MKGNGKMIRGMGEGMKDMRMEMYTQVNFITERHMVKVNMSGKIHRKYMMENGRKE